MSNHHNGIHHISVLAGDPQRNAKFYVQKLGLRMVKKSVNQDDPGNYHLFYGNQSASPGASLTFFPWPHAAKGRPGTGEAVIVAFSVPDHALDYWKERFIRENIEAGTVFERFGQTVLPFKDPDGLRLELVFEEVEDQEKSPREGSVAAQYAIRGFWGTILRLTEAKSTAAILQDILGFAKMEEQGNMQLYRTDAAIGSAVIIEVDKREGGKSGRGTVHHVAFRAADESSLKEMRLNVEQKDLHPTDIIDRHWFKSVYYRTPGGVLFEMATDGPGYTIDEEADHLGEKLVLPPWMESKRAQIEKQLPEITF